MKTKKATPKSHHKSQTRAAKSAKKRIRQARPIHKRVLLHPVSAFVMLCVGVLMVAWTYNSFADSLTVTASVDAPLPSSAATISSPVEQARVTATPINVFGDCPASSYVELYRNGVFSGVATCDAVGKYQILTDLSPGANQLLPKVFNITNNQGPASTPITVWYDQPVIVVPGGPTSGGGTTSTPSSSSGGTKSATQSKPLVPIEPLFISPDYQYQTYVSGTTTSYEVAIKGGVAPYAITVNWQDGQIDTFVKANNDKFKISHTYKISSSLKHSFLIKIKSVDSIGHEANMQLVATIVNNTGIPAAAGSILENDNLLKDTQAFFKNWVWVIWPFYGVVVLMSVSFWLGERQEYGRIITHVKHTRRHHYAK